MSVSLSMEIGTGIRRAARRARTRRVAPERPAARCSATPPPPSVSGRTERARQAGGPQDSGLYSCGCGYLFEGQVTASTSCPRCGTDQAW